MTSAAKRRIGALVMAGAALGASAGTALAVAPTVIADTRHIERPFIDCPGFGTMGIWDIDHKLTIFYDSAGTPIRDIEEINFSGRIVNAETGAWVADAGSRTFFDLLAPDGSFLVTYSVEQRKSQYVHGAGRTDYQTGDFNGRASFSEANVEALCEALGG